MVILHNVERTPFVGNLDHADLRHPEKGSIHAPHGFRLVRVITVDHLADGSLYRRDHAKTVPHAITILGGERSAELPDVVTKCTDVANAIRLGKLRITKQWADPEPEAAKPEPPKKEEKPAATAPPVTKPDAPASPAK